MLLPSLGLKFVVVELVLMYRQVAGKEVTEIQGRGKEEALNLGQCERWVGK
jgi:hypothetical protein